MKPFIKQKEYKTSTDLYTLKKISIPMKYLGALICIFIFITSIGYAAITEELLISGEATFRVEENIRITDLKFVETSNGGVEQYNSQYSKAGIITGIILPNLDSTITYEVTVTNISNIEMKLQNIINENYSNTDIEYVLDGISLNDTILGMSTTVFQITFKYKSSISTLPNNQTLESRLELVFTGYNTTPPVITLNGSDEYTIFSGTTIDLKSLVTVTDDVDTNIEDKLVISSSPSPFSNTKGGLYTISYNVTDSSGNAADEVTITIYVIEFIKIAAGRYHTLALTVDGYVYSWGHNDVRQLGDGTTTNRLNPIKISSLSNIVDISAGYGSSYVVNNTGEVYSWGYGGYGQLGQGSTSNYNSPTIISGLVGEKIINIDAGYFSVIALTEDGRVYTWGANDYRQLGDGTTSTTAKYSPYQVTSLSNIKYISTGYWHMIAATETEVYAWGSNGEGQLGISGQSTTGVPTKLSFTANIKQISAGGRHNFIVTDEGDLYAFGYNYYGQAGVGNTTTVTTPKLITSISNVKQADAGYEHSVAVTNDGKVYAWGYNTYARLGLGNTTTQTSPVLNTNIESIRYVAAQYETTFYINSVGGAIYASGYNIYGALGNGTTSSSNTTTWGSIPSKVIFTSY